MSPTLVAFAWISASFEKCYLVMALDSALILEKLQRPRSRRTAAKMSHTASFRDRVQTVLTTPGSVRTILWLAVLLVCLVLPGIGVILGFVWIAALLWLGRQPVASLGLTRPVDWTRCVVVAVLLAIGVSMLSNFVLEPLVQRWVGHGADLSRMDGLVGNWGRLGLLLLLSWLVGAVVEETVFRGFLIGYGVRLFGERAVWWLVALSAMIFGFSHLYQGLAGMLLTAVVGLILSCAYVLNRRNLVVTMIAHGLIDTIGVVRLFLASSRQGTPEQATVACGSFVGRMWGGLFYRARGLP